jgi:putative transcriptional regulator
MVALQFLCRTLLLAAVVLAAHADPLPSLLLVAKPGLLDPNFRETVVLVTRTADAQTVGVILNRPTDVKLSELSRSPAAAMYKEPLFFGGPVMARTLVGVFHSSTPPAAPAFEVAKDVYLSMHPGNIEPLIAGNRAAFRLYAGFSGWAPSQLESELERDGWYVLPVREDVLFRTNTDGLWRELIEQAQRRYTQRREPAFTAT